MAKDTKTTTPSARERMLSMAREQFPDRTFADIGAEPAEGVADLDDAIIEVLDGYKTRQKVYDDNNSRLSKLMDTDPSVAEFIQRWIDTGDPRTALIEQFGDDLGINDEGKAKFKGQLDSWRERRASHEAMEAEAESNWQASLQALEDWGNSKGLSFEQKRDVMLRLLAITFNGMENKYAAEDFDLAIAAINHDKDVQAARQEGEVSGRNQHIAATRRDRSTAAPLPPAVTGQQGSRSREKEPPKKSFWAEVNNG